MKRTLCCSLLAFVLLTSVSFAAKGAGVTGEALGNLRETQHKSERVFRRDQRQAKTAFLKQLAGNKRLTRKERQSQLNDFNLQQKNARARFRNTQQAELKQAK